MSNSEKIPPKAKIGVQLSAVIALLGERMYSSDTVFIRENVQNAIDAVRMLSRQMNLSPSKCEIRVQVNPRFVEVEDWGVGMSYEDLITYYWNVGSSSKNTPEAIEAGCIGQFGIGGFANFGVCREVHVYTATGNAGENEFYSSVRKDDLEQNKDDLMIVSSSQLKHRGTAIYCVPLKDFEVNSVVSYLKRYVQYVPERVIVNGTLISQKKFLKEAISKSQVKKIIHFKYGWIEGTIVEHPDNRVTFKPEKAMINNVQCLIFGEIELSNDPLEIYKNNFLISDYIYTFKMLSGKLDLPFIKAIASREGFDTTTKEILIAFHASIADLLISYISESQDLLNAYRGTPLTDAIYHNERIELCRNLNIVLLDSTTTTLGDLEQRIQELKRQNLKIYYLEGGDTTTARVLQSKGNIMVTMSGLDKNTRWIAKQFLIKYCQGIEVPSVVTQELAIQDLDGNIRFVLNTIEKSLERQRCPGIKVQPCILVTKEDIPMLFKEEEKKLMINIGHPDFITISRWTNSKAFTLVVEHFLKDYLEDTLARFRRKIFGPRGKGISILAPDERYKLIIQEVEKIHLIRTGGNPWEGEQGGLVQIISQDFPNMTGYYLSLPPALVEAYGNYITQEHKIEVIAFSKNLIYWIYYEIEKSLIIEIELDRFVSVPISENDGLRAFITKLKKHIIVRPKGTYLPIVPELETSFIPTSVPRVLWIGAKLEQEEKSSVTPQQEVPREAVTRLERETSSLPTSSFRNSRRRLRKIPE